MPRLRLWVCLTSCHLASPPLRPPETSTKPFPALDWTLDQQGMLIHSKIHISFRSLLKFWDPTESFFSKSWSSPPAWHQDGRNTRTLLRTLRLWSSFPVVFLDRQGNIERKNEIILVPTAKSSPAAAASSEQPLALHCTRTHSEAAGRRFPVTPRGRQRRDSRRRSAFPREVGANPPNYLARRRLVCLGAAFRTPTLERPPQCLPQRRRTRWRRRR